MKRSRKIILGTSVLLVITLFAVKFQLFATGSNIYYQIQRFGQVMQQVMKYYVEDVDPEKLVDGAINGMLSELDPHSIYIPKDRLKEVNEEFEGEFEGIGIEFVVHDKIPTVISPIADTPSERLGIRPGDQIIKIEGISTYGVPEEEIIKKLRGPKGTMVTLTINRPAMQRTFDLTITRDAIPLYSINASFMLDARTGYVKVGKFAKTTSEEFENALRDLESHGLKQLIVDLRDNSGGYLDQAVEITDKFLNGGKRIVYTRGRIPSSNDDYYSTTEATHPTIPLIVLINHGSASASEIVAGAIQDWDRGLIVGETSFGKGLVQNQIELSDGSAMRVTVARYYTPSGRLIQRSYKNGMADYVEKGFDDIDPNSIPDSTSDKPVFKTSAGRKVFGGGGITPDVRIPSEQTSFTTVKLIQSQIFFDFASEFATEHKELGSDFESFKKDFQVGDDVLQEFREFAEAKKIEIDDSDFSKDTLFMKRRIREQIARFLWGSAEYYQIDVADDPQVKKAMQLFSQAAKIAGLDLNGR